MEDVFWLYRLQACFEPLTVRQVDAVDRDAVGETDDFVECRAWPHERVHLSPLVDQAAGEVGTDETCGAGYEAALCFHAHVLQLPRPAG
jgi:hypothetical protein